MNFRFLNEIIFLGGTHQSASLFSPWGAPLPCSAAPLIGPPRRARQRASSPADATRLDPYNLGDAVLLPSSEPKSSLLFPVAGPSHHYLGTSLEQALHTTPSPSSSAPIAVLPVSPCAALPLFSNAGARPASAHALGWPWC
jgi:hypothetical protein